MITIFQIIFVVVLAFFLFILWKLLSVQVSVKKELSEGKSIVTIDAKKDITSIEFKDFISKEKQKHTFSRKDIKAGERVEFVYSLSNEPISVLVKCNGQEKTIQIIPSFK